MARISPITAALRRLARSTEPIARYRRFDDALKVANGMAVSGQWPEKHPVSRADEWMTAIVLLEDVLQCESTVWLNTWLDQQSQLAGHHHGYRHTKSAMSAGLDKKKSHLHQRFQQLLGDSLPCGDYGLLTATSSLDVHLSALLLLTLPEATQGLSWQWHHWFEGLNIEKDSIPSSLQAVGRWHRMYAWLKANVDALPPLSLTASNVRWPVFEEVFAQISLSTPLPWVRPHWGTIVVEGMSERVYLPAVLNALDIPMDGLMVLDTGGKGPMVNWVSEYKQYFKGPCLILLDSDGLAEGQRIVADSLDVDRDVLCCLPGTLEDTYSDSMIIDVINTVYDPVEPLTQTDLDTFRANQLHTGEDDNLTLFKALWHYYELTPPYKPGPFEKVAFAEQMASKLVDVNMVPEALSDPIKRFYERVIAHRQDVLAECSPRFGKRLTR